MSTDINKDGKVTWLETPYWFDKLRIFRTCIYLRNVHIPSMESN